MNEPYQDDRDDPDVQVVFDGNENEHLDLLRVPVSQATATGETETRGARAKEWIRGTLAVAALFGLCGVGALSLNRTPSLELHAREPGASWLAGEPAAAAAAASCKKAHAPNGAHAPERPAATPVLATFAPLAQGAHSATKQAAKKTKTAPTTPASPGVLPDGRIILNTATAEELTRLKGVGSKRASAIVALRTRLGGFKRISSLLRIRGIGVRTLYRKLDEYGLR